MHYLAAVLEPVLAALREEFSDGDVYGLTRVARRDGELVRYVGETEQRVTLLNSDAPVTLYFGLGRGNLAVVEGRGRGRANTYRLEQSLNLYVSTAEEKVFDELIGVLSRFGGLLELGDVNFDAAGIVRAETGITDYEWGGFVFSIGVTVWLTY